MRGIRIKLRSRRNCVETDNSELTDEKTSLLSEMQAKAPRFQKRTQNTLKILTAVYKYLAAYT